MADKPDRLALAILRRIEARHAAMEADIRDMRGRITAVEIGVAGLYANLAVRAGRMDDCLARIERRLDRPSHRHLLSHAPRGRDEARGCGDT